MSHKKVGVLIKEAVFLLCKRGFKLSLRDVVSQVLNSSESNVSCGSTVDPGLTIHLGIQVGCIRHNVKEQSHSY